VSTLRHLVLLLAVSILAAACATPQAVHLRDEQKIPLSGAVEDPVFFTQETKQCGPAALAMTLVHSGVQVTPKDLAEDVYNPGREGSLTPAILSAARRHGRVGYPIDSLESLFREVSEGRPVLVLQNLGLDWYPQWHYAVVIGYDLDQETVTLHSGETAFHIMPMATFEATWARSGNWGLLTLSPSDIPASANEDSFLKAVAGIERAGQLNAAAEAYEGATKRWPNNLVAWMGLGNAQYAIGNKKASAIAFQTASDRHPDSADAFNNLAHVLAELGALEEAERAGRTAVSLGGQNVDIYRQTLSNISKLRETDGQARL